MSEMSNTPQSISCSGGVVVVVVVGFGLVVVVDGPDGGADEEAGTVVLDASVSEGAGGTSVVVATTGAPIDGEDEFSLLSRADAHAETASAATVSGASTP
ncbi:MAG: hypothetical protein M3501_11745, partial [Actinomycetota bacterium]|nr:hypothetical protein [Actinomycetota bacterium]